MKRAFPARGVVALAIACAVAACSAPDPGRDRAEALSRPLEGHRQAHALTCESRSGADLLAAHGIPATEDDVFRRLPRSDDPDEGFVGDPDGASGGLPPEGYGVHAPPLAAALRDLGLDARAERGRDLAWLRAETDAGRPVIAWVTSSLVPSSAVTLRDARGRTFRAVRGEHTVLVLLVRERRVTFLDPAVGRSWEGRTEEFARAWALFDGAAVSAAGPLARGRPAPP